MKLAKLSTTIHKWVGLLIGIQVVLWVVGGLVMAWIPIEEIRSEHLITPDQDRSLNVAGDLAPISEVLADFGAPASRVVLRRFGDNLVYEVVGEDAEARLFDAASGSALERLDEMAALAIANADFSGEGSATDAILLDAHNTEYRGPLPIWQVAMNDPGETRLYIAPYTGQIVARRSFIWRVYDFFWMLHIMDYENRTDFNNSLLVWSSVVALLMSAAGIVLLFYRLPWRRMGRKTAEFVSGGARA